jgi:hypothetical protein
VIKFTGAAKLNDLKAKQKAYQALHQPRAPFKRLVQNQPIDCYEIDQEQDKIQIGKNNRLLEEDHSNENQNLTNNIQIQTVPTSNDNNQQNDNQISNYLIQFSQYININQNETNNSLLEEDHSKMISIKNKERTLKNLITTRKRVKKITKSLPLAIKNATRSQKDSEYENEKRLDILRSSIVDDEIAFMNVFDTE